MLAAAKNLITDGDITVEVQKDEPVSSLIGKMGKEDAQEAFVFDGRKFIGIFSHLDFLRSRDDVKKIKSDRFLKKVHYLEEDADVAEIAKQMVLSESYTLPVFHGTTYLGVVDAFALLEYAGNFDIVKKTKVGDVNNKPCFVREDDKVGEAIHEMDYKNQRYIILVDKDKNLKGQIRHKDLIEKFYVHLMSPERRQRSEDSELKTRAFHPEKEDIMSLPVVNFISDIPPVTVQKTDSLYDASKKMLEHRIMAVVNEDSLEMISIKDILKLMASTLSEEPTNIAYTGLDDLDIEDREKERVRHFASEYAEKLRWQFNNIFDLEVHIKEHSQTGTRHRYEAHAKVSFPGATLSAKEEDWVVQSSVRKALESIGSQLTKKFRERKLHPPSSAEIEKAEKRIK